MVDRLTCFKAYDIRGRIPDEINEDVAWRIGRAYADVVRPRTVVVGHDIPLSGPGLTASLTRGLTEAGVDVIDIGLCGTEEIYFATWHLDVGGGIVVTASHNPADYNGMKLVREGARPISGDTGLQEIRRLAEENHFPPPPRRGTLSRLSILDDYVEHLLGYVALDNLRPLKLVVDPRIAVAPQDCAELGRRLAVPRGDLGQSAAEQVDGSLAAGPFGQFNGRKRV